MKTQEEIEHLAQDIFEKHIGSNAELGYIPIKKEDAIDAIKEALTQCQEDTVKEYTKDEIEEMALDYIINTGGLPQTIEDWKGALWKFYQHLNQQD